MTIGNCCCLPQNHSQQMNHSNSHPSTTPKSLLCVFISCNLAHSSLTGVVLFPGLKIQSWPRVPARMSSPHLCWCIALLFLLESCVCCSAHSRTASSSPQASGDPVYYYVSGELVRKCIPGSCYSYSCPPFIYYHDLGA